MAMKRIIQRSEEAQAYHRWYSLKRWKDRRLHQLRDEPLCAFCLAQGRPVTATVADHVMPHRGDADLFWSGELQSLCKTHHDASKARQERGGYDSVADLMGYPLDPNHPANR
jgi:5-methylcytosine-specific restriction endonuclease McrA